VLRKQGVGAPASAVIIYRCSDYTISNVLRNTERVLSQQTFTDWQKKALASILQECHNVLIALGKVVDENYHLNLSNVHGFRDKSQRVWKILKWEPDDIQELRSRVALNISLLNAFNESLMRCLSETEAQSKYYKQTNLY